jgi:hypothetical protein
MSQVADVDGVPVRYLSRPAKRDCRELIVVFSSIHGSLDAMDFQGPHGETLAGTRAELLFVHDQFADTYCYYLCRDRRFDVADAVLTFLDRYRTERRLLWSQVTFAGMSKGASAALYLGLRVPDVAIVANAPQLRIGSYLVSAQHSAIVTTMAGRADAEAVRWLDAIMPAALEGNAHRNQHLYLFTGPGDRNCFRELQAHATALTRFRSTSVMSAGNHEVVRARGSSPHRRTLLYFLPAMISLLGVLGSGLRPQLGFTDLLADGRARTRGGRLGDTGRRLQQRQLGRHLRALPGADEPR